MEQATREQSAADASSVFTCFSVEALLKLSVKSKDGPVATSGNEADSLPREVGAATVVSAGRQSGNHGHGAALAAGSLCCVQPGALESPAYRSASLEPTQRTRPVAIDTTTTTRPVAMDMTTSRPVDVDMTTTTRPVTMDMTTATRPVDVNMTTTTHPVDVDMTTTTSEEGNATRKKPAAADYSTWIRRKFESRGSKRRTRWGSGSRVLPGLTAGEDVNVMDISPEYRADSDPFISMPKRTSMPQQSQVESTAATAFSSDTSLTSSSTSSGDGKRVAAPARHAPARHARASHLTRFKAAWKRLPHRKRRPSRQKIRNLEKVLSPSFRGDLQQMVSRPATDNLPRIIPPDNALGGEAIVAYFPYPPAAQGQQGSLAAPTVISSEQPAPEQPAVVPVPQDQEPLPRPAVSEGTVASTQVFPLRSISLPPPPGFAPLVYPAGVLPVMGGQGALPQPTRAPAPSTAYDPATFLPNRWSQPTGSWTAVTSSCSVLPFCRSLSAPHQQVPPQGSAPLPEGSAGCSEPYCCTIGTAVPLSSMKPITLISNDRVLHPSSVTKEPPVVQMPQLCRVLSAGASSNMPGTVPNQTGQVPQPMFWTALTPNLSHTAMPLATECSGNSYSVATSTLPSEQPQGVEQSSTCSGRSSTSTQCETASVHDDNDDDDDDAASASALHASMVEVYSRMHVEGDQVNCPVSRTTTSGKEESSSYQRLSSSEQSAAPGQFSAQQGTGRPALGPAPGRPLPLQDPATPVLGPTMQVATVQPFPLTDALTSGQQEQDGHGRQTETSTDKDAAPPPYYWITGSQPSSPSRASCFPGYPAASVVRSNSQPSNTSVVSPALTSPGTRVPPDTRSASVHTAPVKQSAKRLSCIPVLDLPDVHAGLRSTRPGSTMVLTYYLSELGISTGTSPVRSRSYPTSPGTGARRDIHPTGDDRAQQPKTAAYAPQTIKLLPSCLSQSLENLILVSPYKSGTNPPMFASSYKELRFFLVKYELELSQKLSRPRPPSSCGPTEIGTINRCECSGRSHTNDLSLAMALRAVSVFMFIWCSESCDLTHPCEIGTWILNVDTFLCQRRWQIMASIDAAVLMHLFIILKQALRHGFPKRTGHAFAYVRSSLYVAMSFYSREISYPVRAFYDGVCSESDDFHGLIWELAKLSAEDMRRFNFCRGYQLEIANEMVALGNVANKLWNLESPFTIRVNNENYPHYSFHVHPFGGIDPDK